MIKKLVNKRQVKQMEYWWGKSVVNSYGIGNSESEKVDAYVVELSGDSRVYIGSDSWKKSVLDKLA